MRVDLYDATMQYEDREDNMKRQRYVMILIKNLA